MSNIIPLPTAAPKPVKSGKFTGYWGKRERLHPPNTMPDKRKRVRVMPNEQNKLDKPKNFTGKTRQEAEARRDAWLKSLDVPVVVKPKPMKLNEWADKWYITYGGEDLNGSRKSEVNLIKNSQLGEMFLEDIKPTDVQMFANSCYFSRSYTNSIKSDLKSIFKTAEANYFIEKSPMIEITWTHKGTEGHRALETWERDLICENWHRCPGGVGAMLMLFSGERPSEARAQNKKNITDEYILVRDTSRFEYSSGKLIIIPDQVKTEAGFRDVPIWPQLQEVIAYAKKHDNDLVWISPEKQPLSKTAYDNCWKSFMLTLRCTKAGIKPNRIGTYEGIRFDHMSEKERADFEALFNIAPYTMRHSFCTMLYEAGVDLKTAQYLMGHRDAKTTLMIYTHLSDKKKGLGLDIAKAYFNSIHK